jgi:hypothetical protein
MHAGYINELIFEKPRVADLGPADEGSDGCTLFRKEKA